VTRAEAGVLAAAAFAVWTAAASLLLAANGVHTPTAALAVTVAGAVLVLDGLAVAWRHTRRDRTGALLVLGAIAVGALMYVPAFPYGSSDRDPGVYAYNAYAIARTHTVHIPDPLAPAPLGLHTTLDGQRVPGMHPEPGGTALAGFFLTEPALAATAYDLAGDGGLRLLGPLLGMLALAAFGLAVRRAAGTLAGALAAALLGGNMLVVWQVKTPGPEVLAELAAGAALLAATVAVETRGRTAAGLAGAFGAAVWLARPDGLLVVLLGVALALGCWATRGPGALPFLAGLAVVAPLAGWQAYGLAAGYAERNGVPPSGHLGLGLAGLVVVATVVRYAVRRPWHAPGRWTGYVTVAATVAFLGYLLVRDLMAPPAQPLVNGGLARGYDQYTLTRLADFLTWPGIALAVVGVGALTEAPARAARWLLLAPALLGAPYLYDPRISPDLMFWGRRFVPVVVPGVAVLAAAGVVALLRRGVAGRALAVGFAAAAVAVPYAQSWPLRAHEEYAGTLAAAEAAADVSRGAPAVYLWVRPGAGCCEEPAYLFAGAVWLRYGKASMTVAPEEAAGQAAAAAALPQGWPVLVVGEGWAPPFSGPLRAVGHHEVTVPVWERGGLDRPTRARQALVSFTVWQYVPATRA
jgi:hypothetical protein